MFAFQSYSFVQHLIVSYSIHFIDVSETTYKASIWKAFCLRTHNDSIHTDSSYETGVAIGPHYEL